jgi:hypothetical protein
MTAPRWTGRSALLAALLLAVFGGCSKNDNNHHDILPIKASISFPNPPVGSQVVFMRVAAGDNPDDDLVPLDLVLRTSSPIPVDGVTVELSMENPSAPPGTLAPGIVQAIFSTAGNATVLGPCGGPTCVVHPVCVGGLNDSQVCATDTDCPPCPNASSCQPSVPLTGTCNTNTGCNGMPTCTPCSECPSGTLAATFDVPGTPQCLGGPSGSGTFLMSVLGFNNATCPVGSGMTPVVSSETVLAHFGLLASAEGTVRVRFVTNPNPAAHGDCEILQYPTSGAPIDLGIPFDDGGAVFTSHR